MNYRATKLFAEKSYTADFTELIDINLSDPISRLSIQYEGLQNGLGATAAHPAKSVKKIELVDGSDVLFSLDGMEAYALQFFNNKVLPFDEIRYLNNNYCQTSIALNFGRWLWDPDFALDPKRFNNLQLKIESDQDAGGLTPDASKLQVMASCFDQKSIAPVGFLQAKRVKQYTMGSSSHEYTDLPTDLKIRKLLIKALLEGTEPHYVAANIKLSEDNDKRVIFDNTWRELLKLYPDENQMYIESFEGFAYALQTYIHCTPSERCNGTVNGWTDDIIDRYYSYYDGDGGRARIRGSAAGNWNAVIKGWCPNGVISIPMGDEWDPADWLDPSGLRNLRLDITSGSGMSNTCEILLQQLRLY